MSEMNNDVTPESLMDKFRGPGLMKMVVVTVVVHVVVILVSSLGYLKKKDTSKMSRDQRIAAAVEDASVIIKQLAEEHGLNPQDISDQFASGGSRTAKQAAPETAEVKEVPAEAGQSGESSEQPKSAIEKELEKAVKGPEMPAVGKDDIF